MVLLTLLFSQIQITVFAAGTNQNNATEMNVDEAVYDSVDAKGESDWYKITTEDKSEDMLDKFILKDEIMKLPEKEKKIILLRYFRGKTQGEVAEILGISQVQVSRMETKIISSLKKKMI